MSENTQDTMKVTSKPKGIVYKPEENKLVVKGILTNFRHSTTKYSGDKEYYQVSIRTEHLTPEIVADIEKTYFSDTKEKYLPSVIKYVKEKGVKEPIYINLKSQYEVGTFTPQDGNKRFSYDEVIEMGEGLPPYGSEVTLSIRLKGKEEGEDGSAYPLAIRIDKLVKQDASDYFD